MLKIAYHNKFYYNRIEYHSKLRLFLAYKKKTGLPVHLEENIKIGRFDFDWRNDIDVKFTKKLSIAFVAQLIFDNNVFVQKSSNDLPNGLEEEYSKAVSYFQQILIRYKIKF